VRRVSIAAGGRSENSIVPSIGCFCYEWKGLSRLEHWEVFPWGVTGIGGVWGKRYFCICHSPSRLNATWLQTNKPRSAQRRSKGPFLTTFRLRRNSGSGFIPSHTQNQTTRKNRKRSRQSTSCCRAGQTYRKPRQLNPAMERFKLRGNTVRGDQIAAEIC